MTKFKPLPTQAELHELFDYSVVTGELYWKKTGLPAGSIYDTGYKYVCIKSKKKLAHRIAWKWVTGQDPAEKVIDHINGDKTCNAWHNIRLCTVAENSRNSKRSKGYTFSKRKRKWVAQITVDYKFIHLGEFTEESQARAAYEKASKALHGEFSAV